MSDDADVTDHPGPDFLAAVAEESARFARAAAAVRDRSDSTVVTVPSCPDWSVDDLVWHLTEVQHFWAAIVGDGLDGPEAYVRADRPASADLIANFDAVSARLQVVLAGADPETPCWSWYQADQQVGWVWRRQAHEALIHRVDAELALGSIGGPGVGPIDAVLAADGIDELLDVVLGADPIPDWSTWTLDGPTIGLVATVDDGADRAWLVSPGRLAGIDPDDNDQNLAAVRVRAIDPAGDGLATGDVAAEVSGPAAELDRWLWRRGDLDRAVVTGDRTLVDGLPGLADAD